MSWKPQVIADRTQQWCTNQLRFATKEEADAWLADLMWTAVTDRRSIESEDPVTFTYADGKLTPVACGNPDTTREALEALRNA